MSEYLQEIQPTITSLIEAHDLVAGLEEPDYARIANLIDAIPPITTEDKLPGHVNEQEATDPNAKILDQVILSPDLVGFKLYHGELPERKIKINMAGLALRRSGILLRVISNPHLSSTNMPTPPVMDALAKDRVFLARRRAFHMRPNDRADFYLMQSAMFFAMATAGVDAVNNQRTAAENGI